MDVDVTVGHALDWALVGRLVDDTADAWHLEDAFVVGSHGDSQFVVERGKVHGFQFLASHVFALKGMLRGTLRRIRGDGVDDESVDVGDRGGGDIRRR